MRSLVIATSIFTIGVLAAPVHGEDPPTEIIVEVERVCGPRAESCSLAYKRMRRLAYLRRVRARQLARALRFDPEYQAALTLACTTLRASRADCTRADWIMRCEAGHPGVEPSPRALNATSNAAGLGQFLASTWARTRYALLNVFDPYANSMAVVDYVTQGLSWVHWSASASCWEPRS